MSTFAFIFLLFSVTILIIAAFFAAFKKDLLQAVIATSIISLSLAVIFYILQAPDVALTEAAIGVALSTIVFVLTIRNTKRMEE